MEGDGLGCDATGDLTSGASVLGDCDVVSDAAFLLVLLCRLVRRVLSSLEWVGDWARLCLARSNSAGRCGEARGASSPVRFLSLLFLFGPAAAGMLYRTDSRAPLGESSE